MCGSKELDKSRITYMVSTLATRWKLGSLREKRIKSLLDMLILKGLWGMQMEMYEMQMNVCCGQRPNYSSLKRKWVVKSQRHSVQTNVFKEIWLKAARLSRWAKGKIFFFLFALFYNGKDLDLCKCWWWCARKEGNIEEWIKES